MYCLVPNYIFIAPIMNIDFCEILAIVTFNLWEHPALFVIFKLLLKLFCILEELHLGAFIIIAFSEKAMTVSSAYYATDCAMILFFIFFVIHDILIFIIPTKEVLLLFTI